MQRAQAEQFVKAFYADRVADNLDGMLSRFHDDAELQMLGSPERSAIPFKAVGRANYNDHLAFVIKSFHLSNFEIVAMVVDGDSFAFRWRAKVQVKDKSAVTELVDFWTVKDDKIISLHQACDTALAQWLLA